MLYIIFAGVNGAGKMAVAKLEECFRNGVSVNQETIADFRDGKLISMSPDSPQWFMELGIVDF